jgi:hypothetical protein
MVKRNNIERLLLGVAFTCWPIAGIDAYLNIRKEKPERIEYPILMKHNTKFGDECCLAASFAAVGALAYDAGRRYENSKK